MKLGPPIRKPKPEKPKLKPVPGHPFIYENDKGQWETKLPEPVPPVKDPNAP